MCVSAALLCGLLFTGCQSLSSRSSYANVRVIDVSPEDRTLDIYQGSNAVAYNLSSGTVTSYVPVVPGSANFTVSTAGSRQVLSSLDGTFTPGAHYTVLVRNTAATMQQTLLADHEQPAPTAAPVLRFINEAQRTGAVDIYLVPTGQKLASVSPAVTNLQPGVRAGYIVVPVCTCTAIVLPAGAVASAASIATLTSAHINFVSGSTRSLILLDPHTGDSDLQVITTLDADPL